MRLIGESIGAVPVLVQQRQTIDGELQWITIKEGPLYDLIDNPNPNESANELMNRWAVAVYAAGDGYLIYDPDDKELWFSKSDWVKVVANGFGQIESYQISHRGQSFNREAAHVVHARLANPTGDYYGLPPARVIRDTILTRLYLRGYIKNFFLNDALPGTTFSTDAVLDDEARERIRKELKRLHGGHEKAFNIAVLEQGTKLDRLSHNLKDLIPVDLSKTLREETLAAYNVPHVLVGVLDDASYANAHIQKQLFAETRLEPTMKLLEGALTRRLARLPEFGEDMRLHFDR